MLVLTRKLGQSVQIGDQSVRIVVVGVRGGEVRLGIEAPRSVQVWRSELDWDPAQASNPQADATQADAGQDCVQLDGAESEPEKRQDAAAGR